jgi:hypothetical protein
VAIFERQKMLYFPLQARGANYTVKQLVLDSIQDFIQPPAIKSRHEGGNAMSNTAPSLNNVVDFFSGKPFSAQQQKRIVRLAPEYDGLELLYSNSAHPDRLFSLKILCWALRADGKIVGMVPWLNKIMECPDLQDPLNGTWEGYYDPAVDDIFEEPPLHKAMELEMSVDYFCDQDEYQADEVLQELPDTIGTHALLADPEFQNLVLTEVVSWRLLGDGRITAMLVNSDRVSQTPVLPGDDCLYPAIECERFRYFFQHHIANQIKAENPDALAAIALLSKS